ncbi:hypothetical protein PAMP_019065 [Pampus punctatissimus]
MAASHIAADGNTESSKWPIAPDGYIPNSVIRSWRKRGKEFTKADCWDDIVFYSLYQEDEDEDVSTRILWFVQDEEEDEKEKTDEVKERGKENKDEKKKKEEEKTDVMGKKKGMKNEKDEKIVEVKRKETEDVIKEIEGEKVGRPVLLKQSNNTLPERSLQNTLKTFTAEPQREEVSSKYISRNIVDFLPASCHEKEPKLLKELKEDISVSHRQSLSPKEPQNLTPHPPKPPPPTPEDPQPRPDHQPPEALPIKNQRSLLSSAKYNTITHQTHVPLDGNVLALYRKFKTNKKNSSYYGKLSTNEKHPPAFKAALQTNPGGLSLNSSQGTIETQPPTFTYPECPSHPLGSDYSTQFAQTNHSVKDQRGHKPVPEWRKSLYKLIALQGFRSPRATRLAVTELPLKTSNAEQLPTAVPTLQPSQAAAHQRVLQKIHMKENQEPASFGFHYVIPMASQHSFFILKPCGKTQYGKLQFDWIRGHGESIK